MDVTGLIQTVQPQKQIAVFKHFLMGNIIPKTHTAERSSVEHDQCHISLTKWQQDFGPHGVTLGKLDLKYLSKVLCDHEHLEELQCSSGKDVSNLWKSRRMNTILPQDIPLFGVLKMSAVQHVWVQVWQVIISLS